MIRELQEETVEDNHLLHLFIDVLINKTLGHNSTTSKDTWSLNMA